MGQAFGPRRLGASGIVVSAIGVGTNRWGGQGVAPSELAATYTTSLDAGIFFFDSAEVYSAGRSERHLGHCSRDDPRAVVLASKFAPYPTRFRPTQLDRALDATLARMGRDSIDLYYLHFPYSLVRIESWMDRMAEAVESGKIRAVGVSNCSTSQMRRAKEALARRGIPLAANQVQYSLLHRKPERNGVLATCRELDVALVAYRPLFRGLLGTRLDPGAGATARRNAALLDALELVADQRGVSASQVALNWLLCQDELVIPIPGVASARHAAENAGALTWRLNDQELGRLDAASANIR
jgi:aryl-alcohol dehydrogenase-like predicted oxidoreductase